MLKVIPNPIYNTHTKCSLTKPGASNRDCHKPLGIILALTMAAALLFPVPGEWSSVKLTDTVHSSLIKFLSLMDDGGKLKQSLALNSGVKSTGGGWARCECMCVCACVRARIVKCTGRLWT